MTAPPSSLQLVSLEQQPIEVLPVESPSNQSNLEKTWRLLSILLAVGPPFPPQLLLSLSNLFPLLPDVICYFYSITAFPTKGLCSIPLESAHSLSILAMHFFPCSIPELGRPLCSAQGEPQDMARSKRKRKRKQTLIEFDSSKRGECSEATLVTSKKVRKYDEEFSSCDEHALTTCNRLHVKSDLCTTPIQVALTDSNKDCTNIGAIIATEAEQILAIPAQKASVKRLGDYFDGNFNEATLDSANMVRNYIEEGLPNCDVRAMTVINRVTSNMCETHSLAPLLDSIHNETGYSAASRIADIEAQPSFDIERQESEFNRLEANLGRVVENPICLSPEMNEFGDSLNKRINTSMPWNDIVSNDLDKVKQVEEYKLKLWDELFGIVPDSEDGENISLKCKYVDEESRCTSANKTSNAKADCEPVISRSKTVKDINENALGAVLKVEKELRTAKAVIKSKEKPISRFGVPDKMKRKHENEVNINATVSVSEKQISHKEFPKFESFIVEEEEGSGGYGIVYRARREKDGAIVAIKCPHENAHKSNFTNELRMLERFGGKDFVIKYEGRLKSSNLDCLVLQYVEHDRPEILKKEIDVTQLRWYGYCLFQALASLHKQGIVHRDVKPGNFLFSRKNNRGYIIDFNLAMDLHQKYGIPNKQKPEKESLTKPIRIHPTKIVHEKPFHPNAVATGMTTNNAKRDRSTVRDQGGADGSGLTSVKDPSADRPREPLPSRGRKSLVNFLHGAITGSPRHSPATPSSIRKRIAAPPGVADDALPYPTPMPLNLNGTALIDTKSQKEGPCAGTKGFRAPEVLFRSRHQGTKIDIWSAGVTLLYFIFGRPPFYGDPEQNLKDIAKLRGSEDLWEVSKLHDRESAFPTELLNRQYLPAVPLVKWCKLNSKRRDFMRQIPSSLLDLVDKCLTVNPRLRITADDALSHEFFAPCRA